MKISVIIPVLNERPLLQDAIEKAWSCGAGEVIVVDGGSEDGTQQMAESCTCRLLKTNPGRGMQLNIGAQAAVGDILLFLHVDTWLEENACQQTRHQVYCLE